MSTPRTVIRRHEDMIDERMDRFMDFLEGIVPNLIKMDFIWSAFGVHEDVPWTPDGLRRAHELIRIHALGHANDGFDQLDDFIVAFQRKYASGVLYASMWSSRYPNASERCKDVAMNCIVDFPKWLVYAHKLDLWPHHFVGATRLHDGSIFANDTDPCMAPLFAYACVMLHVWQKADSDGAMPFMAIKYVVATHDEDHGHYWPPCIMLNKHREQLARTVMGGIKPGGFTMTHGRCACAPRNFYHPDESASSGAIIVPCNCARLTPSNHHAIVVRVMQLPFNCMTHGAMRDHYRTSSLSSVD